MATIEARFVDTVHDIDTDWYRNTTDHPQIKRLDTKLEHLAKKAMAYRKSGEVVLIEYSERESRNVNPHTNQPYVNRYLESITPLANAPEEEEIPKVSSASAPRKTDPEDAWRMTLAKASELAVRSIPHLTDPSWAGQMRAALAWAELIYFTAVPEPPRTPGQYAIEEAARAAARIMATATLPAAQQQLPLDEEQKVLAELGTMGREVAPHPAAPYAGRDEAPLHADDDIPF